MRLDSKKIIIAILMLIVAGHFFASDNKKTEARLFLRSDIGQAIENELENTMAVLYEPFQERDIRYMKWSVKNELLTIDFMQKEDLAKAEELLHDIGIGNMNITRDSLSVHLSDLAISEINNHITDMSVRIIRKRIEKLGKSKPSVKRLKGDRIRIDLPDNSILDTVKELVSNTGDLSFHLLGKEINAAEADEENISPRLKIIHGIGDHSDTSFIVERIPIVSRRYLRIKNVEPSEDGMTYISFEILSEAQKYVEEITGKSVGKRIAVVLDGRVVSTPILTAPLSGENLSFSFGSILLQPKTLTLLFETDVLPVPMKVVEEHIFVNPSSRPPNSE